MDVLLRLTTTKKKKWEPLGSLAQVIIEAFPQKKGAMIKMLGIKQ